MINKASSNKLIMYNTLSTIILYAITFFSAPIFSRLLGVDNYGIVQVYNTWVSFFVVILGLCTRGTLSIAKVNLEEDEFIKYQSSVLFLSLIGFIVILFVLILFNPIFVNFFGLDFSYLVVMLFQSFGTYCVYFINTKFTYEMKAQKNLVISVTLALVIFCLSYFLVVCMDEEHLYTGRILGMAIPYVFAGVIVLIYVFSQGKTLYNKKYWKFCIPLCIPLIFHGISGIICSSSDRIMIQKMINVTAVGIYSLAYNFANIMDSIWGALHNSWDPFFFEYIKTEQYKELYHRSKNYIRLYSCLSMGFILLTPEVFKLFAPEEYREGALIIPIIVLSSYAIFIYAFATNYEFCNKRTDMVAIGSVITGISNVIFNIIFIKYLGYIGAAIATLLSNIVLVTVHVRFAKKLVKDKWIYNIRMFVSAIIGLIISVIMYYALFNVWYIRWGYALIIGIYMLWHIYKEKAVF